MAITTPAPPISTDALWRLTVDQYHAMIRAGILTTDDPVELLQGWLITRMPKHPHYRVVTQLTREALARILPGGWYVDAQEPITTADSEPEPDVVVVRGDRRQYLDRHPGPQDVALVVEVADSTLLRDRSFKKRLYADAGIPVYWIVNLVDNRIEVYTEPTVGEEQADYRESHHHGLAEALTVVINDQSIGRIEIRDLLV